MIFQYVWNKLQYCVFGGWDASKSVIKPQPTVKDIRKTSTVASYLNQGTLCSSLNLKSIGKMKHTKSLFKFGIFIKVLIINQKGPKAFRQDAAITMNPSPLDTCTSKCLPSVCVIFFFFIVCPLRRSTVWICDTLCCVAFCCLQQVKKIVITTGKVIHLSTDRPHTKEYEAVCCSETWKIAKITISWPLQSNTKKNPTFYYLSYFQLKCLFCTLFLV